MSIFGNMMGLGQGVSKMMGDSFAGGSGMDDVEKALLESNGLPEGQMGPPAPKMGPPAPTELDETQMGGMGGAMDKIGGALDSNLGRTLTGDNIAGGIAKLFMPGGIFR